LKFSEIVAPGCEKNVDQECTSDGVVTMIMNAPTVNPTKRASSSTSAMFARRTRTAIWSIRLDRGS
jgi:hypothetical protein